MQMVFFLTACVQHCNHKTTLKPFMLPAAL